MLSDDDLLSIAPTPVVALNRAIAVAEVLGPAEALAILDEMAPDLDRYHPMHAARATMLRQLGRTGPSRQAFQRAAELAVTDEERRSLLREVEGLS